MDTTLYVDPDSTRTNAAKKAKDEDKRLLTYIAAQPVAKWFGDWTKDVEAEVRAAVSVPGLRVLVAYNIMYRDGDAYSSTKHGPKNPNEYLTWITKFAKGLTGRSAIVVLEPDGTSHITHLTTTQTRDRFSAMSQAVQILAKAGARVYVDAGDSNWIPAKTMAERLQKAGVMHAVGIATNVAHGQWTADEIQYADEIRYVLGPQMRQIIDTGRNGRGPYSAKPGEHEDIEWCNAPGRGLGEPPRLDPPIWGCDGFLWIKPPGDSDGSRDGAPAAGKFYTANALELARNAVPKVV